jgi:hypothetical protein
VWVFFGDLPEELREVLHNRDRHSLCFPAGLDFPPAAPEPTPALPLPRIEQVC